MQFGRASNRSFKLASQHILLPSTRRAFRGASQRKAQDVPTELSRTRNIGIIAHIDAVCHTRDIPSGRTAYGIQGKTTTTERMLYYSGHTRRIGSMAFSFSAPSIP